MGDLVSILIPAYNAEKYIGQTIQSAIGQTWPNKEIIIIDDGSSDNTLKIARTFKSEGLKVIAQENRGACGARNRALESAQGSYIQWLDADDLLAPEKISQQLKGSINGLTSRIVLTSAFGKFLIRHHKAKIKPDALWQDLAPEDWIVTKFTKKVWMNPTAWLVSRKLTDLAGPWDERLSGSGDDDGEYICRIVSASEKVKFVPEARCYYRRGGPGSLSWKTSQALESFLLSLELSINHLLRLENSERTRKAALLFLQTYLPYFYPDKTELLDRIDALAFELGGKLIIPRVGWKLEGLRRVLGWRRGKEVLTNLRKLKLTIALKWDELLYRITVRSSA
jgi:glycosyltransferase involved in cell wall biosynthesis